MDVRKRPLPRDMPCLNREEKICLGLVATLPVKLPLCHPRCGFAECGKERVRELATVPVDECVDCCQQDCRQTPDRPGKGTKKRLQKGKVKPLGSWREREVRDWRSGWPVLASDCYRYPSRAEIRQAHASTGNPYRDDVLSSVAYVVSQSTDKRMIPIANTGITEVWTKAVGFNRCE